MQENVKKPNGEATLTPEADKELAAVIAAIAANMAIPKTPVFDQDKFNAGMKPAHESLDHACEEIANTAEQVRGIIASTPKFDEAAFKKGSDNIRKTVSENCAVLGEKLRATCNNIAASTPKVNATVSNANI